MDRQRSVEEPRNYRSEPTKYGIKENVPPGFGPSRVAAQSVDERHLIPPDNGFMPMDIGNESCSGPDEDVMQMDTSNVGVANTFSS